MSIKFKAVQKANPRKLDDPKKHYATAISAGLVDLDTLTKRIARRSTTVSDIDIMAVLKALTHEIAYSVEAGETVHLGDLGYFHITIKSKGQDSAKAVSAGDIEAAKVRFVAGKELEAVLKTAQFEKES